MTRVTAIVCETLMEPANHVEVMLGKALALNTFERADQTDGQSKFAVSSGEWTETQIFGVQNPAIIDLLQRAGRLSEIVDIDLARQAQAATRVVFLGAKPIPKAEVGQIFLVVGDEPEASQILQAAGLSSIYESISLGAPV
ncbi:hypothetical protein [Epibacterium ulvae]|uniref:hypothetical protein n=1 Tax=Epibacterium ulvae TaxID=1156985 RepID=UPI002490FDEE|nr:hypothetical protein [Epibacterium ulvae]